jgi:hypothetical protein
VSWTVALFVDRLRVSAQSQQQAQVRSSRPQWPPSCWVEFGEFGFDVDGDDAEEVDVLAVRWGDVGEDLVGYGPAFGAQEIPLLATANL